MKNGEKSIIMELGDQKMIDKTRDRLEPGKDETKGQGETLDCFWFGRFFFVWTYFLTVSLIPPTTVRQSFTRLLELVARDRQTGGRSFSCLSRGILNTRLGHVGGVVLEVGGL